MKSLQKKFTKSQKSHQGLSSLTHFSRAITGGNFSPKTIRYYFNIFVEKDDYSPSTKMELLAWLYTL
jgi:hypothetical protein